MHVCNLQKVVITKVLAWSSILCFSHLFFMECITWAPHIWITVFIIDLNSSSRSLSLKDIFKIKLTYVLKLVLITLLTFTVKDFVRHFQIKLEPCFVESNWSGVQNRNWTVNFNTSYWNCYKYFKNKLAYFY